MKQGYKIQMRVDSIIKNKKGKIVTFIKDNGSYDDSILELSELGLPPIDIGDEVEVEITFDLKDE